MKQKLYLHIGMGKTGSTAIQHFCEQNSDLLEDNNILFAPDRVYEHWPVRPEPYGRALEFLDNQIGKGMDVLVSDETMYLNFADNPRSIFLKERYGNAYDIRVIVYLRRQDKHIESLVNFLRTGGDWLNRFEWIDFPSRFPELYPGITSETYDYYSWVKPMTDVFGTENVDIRVYDPHRFRGGNVVNDFLDALGVEAAGKVVQTNIRVNQSLDRRFTDLALEMDSLFPERNSFEKVSSNRAFMALNRFVGVTGNRSIFSTAERKAMLDHYSKGNDRIARELLGQDGPLFDNSICSDSDDIFRDGELEKLAGIMNKIWFDTVSEMSFGAFTSFKMRVYQDLYHSGDKDARKKYRWHKLVNSIGKRLFKGFYVGQVGFPSYEQSKNE